jgi:Uncharacterized small protein
MTQTKVPKYKEGDIVQLVSGGPKMTIDSIQENLSREFTWQYYCTWFAGNKLESARLGESSLILWPDSAKETKK